MKVPVLQTDKDSWWHRRDPRVKWLVFFLLIVLIYVAPSWIWMAGMVAVGILLAVTAKAPAGWIAILLLIQVPNILGLIVFPMLGGEITWNEEFEFGLRMALGWIAAILIGVALLSTMQIADMVAGLRGLGMPRRFAFVIGYAFVLVYLSADDLTRVIESLQLKGLTLSPRHPVRFLRGVMHLFAPALFTVARRGGEMTAALESRGSLSPHANPGGRPLSFDVADGAVAVLSLGTVAIAAVLRFGLV